MPSAEAVVTTQRGGRYLTQLCRHLDQMSRIRHTPSTRQKVGRALPAVTGVEYSDTAGTVRFAEGVICLEAGEDTLNVRIDAVDLAGLRRLQDGVAARLQTIGHRDRLTLVWHPSAGPPGAPTPVTETMIQPVDAGAPKRRPRGRLGVTGLLAAGALMVAGHLGMGGVVVAALTRAGWAGGTLLVTVVGGAVLLVGHVFAGRYAVRGGKSLHARWKRQRTSSEDTT